MKKEKEGERSEYRTRERGVAREEGWREKRGGERRRVAREEGRNNDTAEVGAESNLFGTWPEPDRFWAHLTLSNQESKIIKIKIVSIV
jgi:hypothetical protein